MSPQQVPHKLFIQMSGSPGSGKSTTARLLQESVGGVILDHDIFRSSLLELQVPFGEAAKQAYKLQWTLAEEMLKQGHSVIVDSPCNFREALDRGSELAGQHGCAYWYVECRVQDAGVLAERLRTREGRISQRTTLEGVGEGNALLEKWTKQPCRPEENLIVVDTAREPEEIRKYVLKRIVG